MYIGIDVGLPDTPDLRETLIANDVINLINLSAFPEIFNWPGTAWFHLIALIGKLLDFFGWIWLKHASFCSDGS